ncbi:MAG: SCO1664 family protein [Acidimicrobiales bacterium]|nr:SCO1664 family protein [Acidimicrobiales bacterium]
MNLPPRRHLDDAATLDALRTGPIDILGRMPWSSNGTYLVSIDAEGERKAIYKPLRGERPLWDFPSGLYKREIAAYELSAALGWQVVPPTVLRDGPLGEGSLQLFVDADFEQHYFTVSDEARYKPDLQAICAFDIVANNTDRKSGHCLIGKDERVYAIDNGLSFHAEFKLRTVLWDYAGEEIPMTLLDDLERLAQAGLPAAVGDLLDDDEERDACLQRTHLLLRSRRFPSDPTGRRYPWPLV